MQVYKYIIKSTGIDLFTFYATTCAEKCNHQLVVATTGAFTLTSVMNVQTDQDGRLDKGCHKNDNDTLKTKQRPLKPIFCK